MTELLDRVRGALVGLKMPWAIDTLLSEEYVTRESRRIDVALRTATAAETSRPAAQERSRQSLNPGDYRTQ